MLPETPVLLLLDLQQAVDHPSWGPRHNPSVEANVARLLAAWRQRHLPIVHVHHDSIEPASTFRPGQIGNEFKPEAAPLEGEQVIVKHTNSAFIGTPLEPLLRSRGYAALVVVGVTTNNAVEATVGMAGGLGFQAYVVEDGCFAFGKLDWSGRPRTAQEVHDMSLANLNGEYCVVIDTQWVLEKLGA
jgi:nicotinamidase-related amidase